MYIYIYIYMYIYIYITASMDPSEFMLSQGLPKCRPCYRQLLERRWGTPTDPLLLFPALDPPYPKWTYDIYICIGFCNFDIYFVYLEAFIYDRLSNFILENTYYCKWTHYVLSSLYTKWELRCSNHTKIICSICHQYNISISIWFQQLGPKPFRASGSLLRQGGITSGDWKSRSRGKRDRSGCRIRSIFI